MSNLRIRLLTTVLLALAAVLITAGMMYIISAADELPAFFPGSSSTSGAHHVADGLTVMTLGICAVIAAWFPAAGEEPGRRSATRERWRSRAER